MVENLKVKRNKPQEIMLKKIQIPNLTDKNFRQRMDLIYVSPSTSYIQIFSDERFYQVLSNGTYRLVG